jgi:transposase
MIDDDVVTRPASEVSETVHSYGVPLTQAAREAQVPLRTAQRWLVRYRAGGLAALARHAPGRSTEAHHRNRVSPEPDQYRF